MSTDFIQTDHAVTINDPCLGSCLPVVYESNRGFIRL
jgi:hypothetical protein